MRITDTLTHEFSRGGRYSVTITVEDDDGGVAATTIPITIG
ncbi:MAG: PKD domain-containing protein [Thermoplasmata archaeon]